MNTNLANELYCSTFGHNLYLSKSLNDSTDELRCKHCDIKIISDVDTDLTTSISPKKELRLLLMKFYLLKRITLKETIALKA